MVPPKHSFPPRISTTTSNLGIKTQIHFLPLVRALMGSTSHPMLPNAAVIIINTPSRTTSSRSWIRHHRNLHLPTRLFPLLQGRLRQRLMVVEVHYLHPRLPISRKPNYAMLMRNPAPTEALSRDGRHQSRRSCSHAIRHYKRSLLRNLYWER